MKKQRTTASSRPKKEAKRNIVIKTTFLGPRAENASWFRRLATRTVMDWFAWRRDYFPADKKAISADEYESKELKAGREKTLRALDELLRRFDGEIPSFSPRYIGHMTSEISIPALLGHITTLLHNPNNISGEVSRVGLAIEEEAIEALVQMLGYEVGVARGHFTSGGTVANIEGLVRARYRLARWLAVGAAEASILGTKRSCFETAHRGWESYEKTLPKVPEAELEKRNFLYGNPYDIAAEYSNAFGTPYRGPVVLATSSKHYSWPKGILLLGLGREAFWPVELDSYGRMSLQDLRKKVERARSEGRPVLCVVSIAGTTELGDFDPIDEIADYLSELRHREGLHIYHHVDAAYGGFFCSVRGAKGVLTERVEKALAAIPAANSVTIDPHKLGYVPYSSGAFLARDPREYYVAPFDAPYIKWTHKPGSGPQTLDGSRSAAGAAATWLSAKAIGFDPNGLGVILAQTIKARVAMEESLRSLHSDIRIVPHSETNIVCFTVARHGEPLSKSNERVDSFYKAFSTDSNHPFYVSRTTLQWPSYAKYLDEFIATWHATKNTEAVKLLRITLMNPFFEIDEENSYREMFCLELLKVINF